MFHNNIAENVRSHFSAGSDHDQHDVLNGPRLVVAGEIEARRTRAGIGKQSFELLTIAARRCSAFFAEAAVLVLVFGILDFFMLKGRIESSWVAGAFAISVLLLAASVATEFSARRWLGAHP